MSAPGSGAPRLAVGVVGVGRAGSALGGALRRAGHPVVAVHAISEVSRARAESFLPEAGIVSVPEVFAAADLVLLTVPDDILGDLVAGVAAAGAGKASQFVVHASGRYGLAVLDPLTAQGAVPLALHPAMTLTGTSVDLQRLVGAPFAITAPESVRPVAEALVVEMGGEPLWVPDSARTAYHAALSHGANHLITLVADSMDVLRRAGIDDPARLLTPLVTASLDNVLRAGDSALTGPVSRGDAGTVAAHLAHLAADDPAVADAYRVLARRTADRALASGRLSPEAAERLLNLLASPTGSDEK